MNIEFTKKSLQQYNKLQRTIQKKADKQFDFLLTNYRHPSLRTRRMGRENVFEGRIDRSYRFTFLVEEDIIYIISLGPHDEGLGKK